MNLSLAIASHIIETNSRVLTTASQRRYFAMQASDSKDYGILDQIIRRDSKEELLVKTPRDALKMIAEGTPYRATITDKQSVTLFSDQK